MLRNKPWLLRAAKLKLPGGEGAGDTIQGLRGADVLAYKIYVA